MTNRNPIEEAAARVAGLFLGGSKKGSSPARRKPNRCLGCGKVSKTIFCAKTYRECQALYRSKEGDRDGRPTS